MNYVEKSKNYSYYNKLHSIKVHKTKLLIIFESILSTSLYDYVKIIAAHKP